MKQVNKSIPKVDGLGLVTGKPVYTNDLAPENALIVKVLRSPHPFAKIKNINTEEARNLKGVECVLTYKDVPRNIFTRAGQSYPEPSPYDKYILDEYVRYVGDEVAIVAARDEEIAEIALNLIEVEYEILEPVLDFEKAISNSLVIHPEKEAHTKIDVGYEPSKNIAASCEMTTGDIDKVLKECDVTVKNTYYTQAQAHSMMETPRAFSYLDHQGRLIVVSATQVPFHVRRILAVALGIPASQIRIIKPRIGGGFGARQAMIHEIFVAIVTLKTGKPAKIVYSRRETFEATCSRHPMRLDVTLGATKDGKIKAIDLEILSNTGAYGEHAPTVYTVGPLYMLPIYKTAEAVRLKGKAVYTNLTPGGAFRGYGVPQICFALESAVNELAHKMNIDPVVLRKMNMIKKGDNKELFLKDTVDIVGSCELEYCIERGKELIGWDEKFPRKKVSKHKVRGMGMGLAAQGSGIAKVDMGSATIKLNDDGFFNLLVGATEIGTGSDTILAQIAAETLGVDVDEIIVYSSDTDLTPFDTGAYASSTTYVTGTAVKKAAKKMLELIKEEASKILEVTPDLVVFEGSSIKIKNTDKFISYSELASILYYSKNQQQLVATASFVGDTSPPPFVAGFAEVEVDTETGKVDLINFVGVVDCGTVVNPNLARIQAEGGFVQGIGMTLFEEVKYNLKGKLTTNNFMNYKIPSRKDINNIVVDFAKSYEPTGPYGAKSIGEVVFSTPLPAISDAVYNAVGVRITSLPITPEKVLLNLRKTK